jgi:hypothetical protein
VILIILVSGVVFLAGGALTLARSVRGAGEGEVDAVSAADAVRADDLHVTESAQWASLAFVAFVLAALLVSRDQVATWDLLVIPALGLAASQARCLLGRVRYSGLGVGLLVIVGAVLSAVV